MKYIKEFILKNYGFFDSLKETFTFGDLDEFGKADLEEELAVYSGLYEFVEDKQEEIEEIKYAVQEFKEKIPLFDVIHIQLINNFEEEDWIASYSHESVLRTPIIFLSLEAIKEAYEDGYDNETIIHSSIYHELGHAMVDLDNQIEFIEGENILDVDDEEEWSENFAFEFGHYGEVSDEIENLVNQYTKYKKG